MESKFIDVDGFIQSLSEEDKVEVPVKDYARLVRDSIILSV